MSRQTQTTLPQGAEKAAAVRAMFDGIAPRYDLLNRLLTFGMDIGWRRRAVASLGLTPTTVIDLACGTGDLCRQLAAAGHQPVGVDISWGMLARARTGAPLMQADALVLPLPDGAAGGATCGFALRNVIDLDQFFSELARVVRPGGRIALLEVATPDGALLHRGHALYFGQVVPRVGALLSDGDAYRYLPDSVAYLPAPAELLDRLRARGFVAVVRQLLSFGIAQVITATKSADR